MIRLGPPSTRAWGAVIFLLVIFYADAQLWIGSERVTWVARALAEHGETSIDATMRYVTGDLARHAGRYYSGCEPGMGILGVPFAWLAGHLPQPFPTARDLWTQILMTAGINAPALAALFVLWAGMLCEGGMHRSRALVLSGAMTLGTSLFFYSTRVFEYTTSCVLLTLLVRIDLRRRPEAPSPWDALALGILVGLLYTLNSLGGACAVAYLLLSRAGIPKWSELVAFAPGLVAGLAPKMIYNTASFGHPFAWSYNYSVGVSVPKLIALFPTREAFLAEVLHFAPMVAWDYTFGGQFGFFTWSPFLLVLAYEGARRLRFRHLRDRHIRGALAAMIANILPVFLLIRGVWYGGPPGGGSRYVLFALPFLVLLMARGGYRGQNRLLLPAIGISLFLASVSVQYGHNTGLVTHLGLFAVGGPTSSILRAVNASWASWEPVSSRLSQVEPNISGYYYALSNPGTFLPYMLLLLAVAAVLLYSSMRAGRAAEDDPGARC